MLGRIRQREFLPGCRLAVHPVADRFGYAVYDKNGGDPEFIAEMRTFVSRCRPGMTLLDVGAHFGVFSLVALRVAGPDASAVAVEPSRGALRILRRQRRLNRVENGLTIVEAAASDRAGSISLVSEGVASSSFLTDPRGRPSSETVTVRAVTIDGLIRELKVEPTHLKIDVEGQEAAVLRGAETCLRELRPTLFLELHNDILRARGDDPENLVRFLKRLSYRPVEPADSWRVRPVARLLFEPEEGR
ncbi:MAG: FkbM family methyltransferase [Methylacidiphilaceae bacterium]|nr:FkbM family methyltransferase [Candidatus Methylacidiphilaceae bacterium]